MKKTAWENRKLDVYRRKKGKLDTSHRYDLLPLLRSSPGGIQRELVVYDFPECKGTTIFRFCKKLLYLICSSQIRGKLRVHDGTVLFRIIRCCQR